MSDPDVSGTLSVCVIACNEERDLGRCLDSTAWATERVVVVDARSHDATEKIAREAGARVWVRPYEGNIEQKNFALEQARGDWILALDADEAVPPALAREIQDVVAGRQVPRDGFELNRVTFHLGRWIRHGDFFPDWQLRLFRRGRARWGGVNPHGRLRVEGRTGRLQGELEHYSYRDLADQVERAQEFSRIQARALRLEGRPFRLRDLVLRPPARFLRAYLLKQGFRDGIPGLVIAAVSSFHVFLKYAKQWELARSPERAEPEMVSGKAGRAAAGADGAS